MRQAKSKSHHGKNRVTLEAYTALSFVPTASLCSTYLKHTHSMLARSKVTGASGRRSCVNFMGSNLTCYYDNQLQSPKRAPCTAL